MFYFSRFYSQPTNNNRVQQSRPPRRRFDNRSMNVPIDAVSGSRAEDSLVNIPPMTIPPMTSLPMNGSDSSELKVLRNDIKRLELMLKDVIASQPTIPLIDLTNDSEEKVKVENEACVVVVDTSTRNLEASNLITFSPSVPIRSVAASNTPATQPLIRYSPSDQSIPAIQQLPEPLIPLVESAQSTPATEGLTEPLIPSQQSIDHDQSTNNSQLINQPTPSASVSSFFVNDGKFLERYQQIVREAEMQGK